MSTTRTIRVVIDASQARAGAAQANAALASIGSAGQQAQNALNNATRAMTGTNNAANTMARGLQAANNNASAANNSILRMAGSVGRATIALAGLAAVTGGLTGLAMALTGAADAASGMEARLRIATGSSEGLAVATAEVRKIANQTRSDMGAVSALYAKMAANSANLGVSQSQVGVATKTFAMALKVSGASAQEASSSILQLGQAMGSGVLAGDEFKSLAENSPVFMGMLAQSMGVPIGALKKLGSEGKITGEQIAKALTDPKIIERIEQQFGQIPVTFADVRTSIGNAMIDIAASLKKGLGIDDSLAVMVAKIQQFAQKSGPFFEKLGAQIRSVFSTLAPVFQGVWSVVGPILSAIINNMGTITRLAIAVGGAFLVMKSMMAMNKVIVGIQALAATMGVTSGVGAIFTGVMTAASRAVNGFTAALLANPFTAIITGITLAVGLLYQFSDQIQIGTEGMGTLADLAAVVWEDISAGLSVLADVARSVFSSIGEFFDTFCAPIADLARMIFGDVNFSLMGALKVAAIVTDGMFSFFRGSFMAIKAVWGVLPQVMGAIVTNTARAVISGIEDMVNKAINGLNALINMAKNIPGVGALLGGAKIGNVQFAKPAGMAVPSIGAAAAGGFAAGQSTWAQDYVQGLGPRIDQRAAQRNRRSSKKDPIATAMPNSAAPGGADGASDAAKKLKEGANAASELAKKVNDFWQGLEDARAAAGKVGFELQYHNKYMELSRTLGRALTKEEENRLNVLLRETAALEVLGDAGVDQAKRRAELNLLEQHGANLKKMSRDDAEDALAVETRLSELKLKWQLEGVDLTRKDVQTMLEGEKALILQNRQLERGNALLEKRLSAGEQFAKEALKTDGGPGSARRNLDKEKADRLLEVEDARKANRITLEEYQAGLRRAHREHTDALQEAARRFRDEIVGAITQIGDVIGGKLGDAINKLGKAIDTIGKVQEGDYSQSGILGGIARLFGKKPDGTNTRLGDAVNAGADNFFMKQKKGGAVGEMVSGIKSMGEGFKSFKSAFDPKMGGSFVKGLGNAIGGAMQGAAIGSAVAGVGKMLWGKFSNTGAQVGGAIGSIGGPIGSLVGSVIGGTIGGLLKKSKTGSQSFTTDANGNLVLGSVSGNSATMKGAAAGAGQQVVSSIYKIAEALGADLKSVQMASIGLRDGKYRVDFDGSGDTKKKKGAKDFGKQGEAAAISAVIIDALRKGILTGISAFSDRLIRGASEATLDGMVNLAAQYEGILTELDRLRDPSGFAINDLNKQMDRLVTAMKNAGAGAEELGNVEQYRSLKLKEIVKDQLNTLNDFRKSLFGQGSGVTALNRLNSEMSAFGAMRSTISSGGTVDQDEFSRIGQEIFNLAREVYGTSSSQFQSIRNMLIESTDGAIKNASKQFDDATVVAINRQTDAITQNQVITNDLLMQQNEILRGMIGPDAGYGDSYRAVNGSLNVRLV